MLIGINFTGKATDTITLETLRKEAKLVTRYPGTNIQLHGIADNPEQAALAKIQANNGHRRIFTMAGQAGLIGIYVG
jgi:hypothetical protein